MDGKLELWFSKHSHCLHSAWIKPVVQNVLGVKGNLISSDLGMLQAEMLRKTFRCLRNTIFCNYFQSTKKATAKIALLISKSPPPRFQKTARGSFRRSTKETQKAEDERRVAKALGSHRGHPALPQHPALGTQPAPSTQRAGRLRTQPQAGPSLPQRRRPASCYQASAQPIPGPGEHKMAFELPTSNFLLFLEYTQCNAVCLSAMRHKGTAIL